MKKNASILTCIAELVIGILLLINPVGFTRGIIVALGIFMTFHGLSAIVKYIREKPQAASEGNLLARGLLLSCAGLFCVFRSSWFIAAFPVLTVLYGVMTLVTAFEKIQWTADLLRIKHRYWFVALINALMSLILSILILTNPFASTAALWLFIGISLIAEAVVDVVTLIFERK